MTFSETLMVIATTAMLLVGIFYITVWTWKLFIKGIKYSIDEIVDTWEK